jgi:hypothetical protein
MQNLKLTTLLEKMIRAEIKRKPLKETYFRLYDNQTGRYMSTGYNATSEEDLADQYKEYVRGDADPEDEKYFRKASTKQILDLIKANEFDIEESPTPFPEEDEDSW